MPAIFEQVEKAYDAGDIDLLAELETQLWFDGTGRTPEQVNPAMRQLAHDMAHHALSQEAKRLGKRLPDAELPAAGRLGELGMPVLVAVGSHDTPYILDAADYMVERIPSARKAVIEDAAHLANMDQPDEYRHIVTEFLDSLPR
jgi:pimeloyl-ACP methyl ester carboxylesterase